MKEFYLTEAGIDKLKVEQDRLVAKRAEVAQRLKAAHDGGEFSDETQYTAMQQDHEVVERRIAVIDNILRNTKLIQEPKDKNIVHLGTTVRLKSGYDEKQFQVVGTVEADPLNGKISDESPLGKLLLGKKEGDEVQIKSRAKTTTYTIVGIA